MNEKDATDINKERVLEEFRNAWKQEVKRKAEKPVPGKDSSSKEKEDTTTEKSIVDMVERTESLTTNDQDTAPVTALDHYVIAVDNERQGKLGKGEYGSDKIMVILCLSYFLYFSFGNRSIRQLSSCFQIGSRYRLCVQDALSK